MAFWSSQTLTKRVKEGNLIAPSRDEAIDCNAYTLRVGAEIYVTPTFDEGSASTHTKQQLAEGEAFPIPSGQFAFLITEESVSVPTGAMAFISIKARIKFRGLVNVSGFHVDPGWKGPLIFSVFNAGPGTVHLQRGQDMFLIWYADLDEPSNLHRGGEGPKFIPTDLINNITGELNSLQNLATRIRDVERQLSDRIHGVENSQTRITVTFGVILTLLAALIVYAFRGPLATILKFLS
jgi:dCTP deaminase